MQSGESYKNGAGHELGRKVELEIDGPGDGTQHPGVYADADRTAEPAIWPWDPPDSGQQQRSKMKDVSLFWIRPPQKAAMD